MLIDLIRAWKEGALPDILKENPQTKPFTPIVPQSSFHFNTPPNVVFVKDIHKRDAADHYGELPTLALLPKEQEIYNATKTKLAQNKKFYNGNVMLLTGAVYDTENNTLYLEAVRVDYVFMQALPKMKAEGCKLVLMASPQAGREYKESEKNRLFLYADNDGGFFYVHEQKKQPLKLINPDIEKLLKSTPFDQPEEKFTECNNSKIRKAVLSVTAERGHTETPELTGSQLHDKDFFTTGVLTPFISQDDKVAIATRNDGWKLKSVAGGFLECAEEKEYPLTDLVTKTAVKEAEEEFVLDHEGRSRFQFKSDPVITSISFRDYDRSGVPLLPCIDFLAPRVLAHDADYIRYVMNNNEAKDADEHVKDGTQSISVDSRDREHALGFVKKNQLSAFLYGPSLFAASMLANPNMPVAHRIEGVPTSRFYDMRVFKPAPQTALLDEQTAYMKQLLRR